MNMISASAVVQATAPLPLASDGDTAASVFVAAGLLLPHLERGQRIDAATLRGAMEAAFGASDATGAWDWKTAYDACEAATVMFLRKYGKALLRKSGSAAESLPMLAKIAGLLPTHTRRSEEAQTFQQFSTPIPLGLIAATAASITPADRVLEPSAGTGLLAILAEIAGGTLVLNELAETRAVLLSSLFPACSIKREGVSRDGEKGVMFDAETDRADDLAFADHCQDDRHHFRFIISPEDAGDMEDLCAFTRDLARQMEADLGTRLDWIAVDHWNTDNPHVHLIVRGVDDTGADLVISRDYISHGLRGRAEELVDAELGPKPEHEIRSTLAREVDAERWTRFDREIARQSNELGYIDLRPEAKGPGDPEIRRLLVARLRHFEKMGLATDVGVNEWFVEPGAERTLRDLGQRGDIIKTMHRAFAGRGEERAVADFTIDTAKDGPPIIGRLVDKGLHDELTGEAYAVIDGTDGRAHHVRLRGIEAFENAPPIGGPDDPRPTIVLANRSDLDLQSQITAPGATWLDHRLVERDPMPLAMGGFGHEVREAMDARAEHLADEGLARREGQRIVLQRNLLATLRRRELDAVGEQLSAETGLAHVKAQAGEYVAGTYRRQIALSSGRFAVIEGIAPDGGRGFQLVPWSREIEHKLGQHISGVARSGGGIDWSLGRKRDLGL